MNDDGKPDPEQRPAWRRAVIANDSRSQWGHISEVQAALARRDREVAEQARMFKSRRRGNFR